MKIPRASKSIGARKDFILLQSNENLLFWKVRYHTCHAGAVKAAVKIRI